MRQYDELVAFSFDTSSSPEQLLKSEPEQFSTNKTGQEREKRGEREFREGGRENCANTK
jgi:hypothetical protein